MVEALTRYPTKLQRTFSVPVLGQIGIYSYAIYLFHLPLESIVRGLGLHPSFQAPILGSILPVALLYIVGNAAVAYLAGWASWYGFEKFFMQLRRRLQHPE